MEKELTRLLYDFLKRSDSYGDFIKTIRPITKAKRNPVDCANRWGDSGKDPVLNGHLLNLWRFGDVFKVCSAVGSLIALTTSLHSSPYL